jgi:hypothetical protein
MYALINCMNGSVLSHHRSVAACQKAHKRVQPKCVGPSKSYLPTRIMRSTGREQWANECTDYEFTDSDRGIELLSDAQLLEQERVYHEDEAYHEHGYAYGYSVSLVIWRAELTAGGVVYVLGDSPGAAADATSHLRVTRISEATTEQILLSARCKNSKTRFQLHFGVQYAQ